MLTKIYEWRDLIIWRDGDRYYAEYDAGSTTEIARRDEITIEEANLACQGSEQAMDMLWKVQRRLIAAGIDPYKSNLELPP